MLPGRALWVWGEPNRPGTGLSVSEWAAEEQVVQDALASERGEFSVVAERTGGVGYALSGRMEELGEAAVYGAPELMRGGYTDAAEALEVSLEWDGKQVLQFGGVGSPATLNSMVESLKASLLLEFGTIAGE